MYIDRFLLWLLVARCACAERWAWPDAGPADSVGDESVRIDNKVSFIDSDSQQRNTKRDSNIQADEIPFEEATDTQGFYNQPPGAGRYPVRVEQGYDNGIRINGQTVFLNDQNRDGALDSLQHCKCVSRPDCQVQTDYNNACGTNQYLCCYNQPRQQNKYPSEYFNEVDDHSMLYPNQANIAGAFLPPNSNNGLFRPNHETYNNRDQAILVGPGGPTDSIGPQKNQVLVGPGGPTGVIGPERPAFVDSQGENKNHGHKNILVGPEGPTGEIGPSESAQRGVLVGPGGPTGIIGPAFNRPVLVGPGGPTGMIGPRRQGVLVGPGGPTGIIGPSRFNRPSQNPGVLVGPGGPTGIIGPGRQILVGPGGPTGCSRRKKYPNEYKANKNYTKKGRGCLH
ncbi:unnamed protein product, partial [Brenthis ino]